MVTKGLTRRAIFSNDLAIMHQEHQQKRIERGRLSVATLETQMNYAKNIHDFLTQTKRAALPATALNERVADDLLDHLLRERKFSYGHVEKHMKHLKQVLRWSADRQLIKRHPLQ